MLFFRLHGVADLAVEAGDWALIEKLWRDWSPGWEAPADENAHLKRSLGEPSVTRASLGYYRAMLGRSTPGRMNTLELFRTKIRVPTVALTGALDGCVDTRLYEVAMKKEDFPRGIEVVQVEGAGHFLHQERAEEINRIRVDWLRGLQREAGA